MKYHHIVFMLSIFGWLLSQNAFARGATAPPRPYAGLGSIGSWLGDGGRGPVTGFEHTPGEGLDGEGIGGGPGDGGCDGCGWGGWSGLGWVWDPTTGHDNHPNPDPQNCPGTCWACMGGDCVNLCWCEIEKPGTMRGDDGWAVIGACVEMDYLGQQWSSDQCRDKGDQCVGYWHIRLPY